MISAIVAVNEDWGIGYQGQLLEHIPEDLKYFKAVTTDHIVVMGSKTWDSIPKKPLPDRTNIIISNKGNLLLENGANPKIIVEGEDLYHYVLSCSQDDMGELADYRMRFLDLIEEYIDE